MRTGPISFVIFLLFYVSVLYVPAQQHWNKKTGFVLEYGNVPAWAGIVDLAVPSKKPVYIFDDNVYHGHSNFVLRYLKRKVTFTTFKDLVKYPEKRQYIPFNLYDLRGKDFSYAGVKYNWAIKMCDYVLQDTPEQMEQLIADTYAFVSSYLKTEDQNCGPGLFLLSNSETATPNISCLTGVRAKGIAAASLKEFYSLINYHPLSSQVLNEGVVEGILKIIVAGEENNAVNDNNAIYVFERTPERVPLAKAFITLQPQTFLSHINLLAINRKTPNISTADKELISEIKSLNGKAVKLSCTKKENEVTFQLLASFEPATNSQERKTQLIPYQTGLESIVDLDDSTHNTLNFVGAKAANYALLQKQFPLYVRKGAAIPFSFYKNIIEKKEIAEKINEYILLPDTAVKQRIQLQKKIRSLIILQQLPSQLITSVQSLQNKKFKGKKIRIRSSTNCEDLPEFNGAGLYLSKGIKPGDSRAEINNKLLMVFASMWNDNACSERRFFGIDHREAGMAILINEAYESEWANGVALVMPADSGRSQLVIDAQPGDHEVTNPAGGDVPEELFFPDINDNKYTTTSRSKYGKVFIGMALTKNLVTELRNLCLEIDTNLKMKMNEETAKKFGTDIEFKIIVENGKARLWVKQARLLNLGQVQ